MDCADYYDGDWMMICDRCKSDKSVYPITVENGYGELDSLFHLCAKCIGKSFRAFVHGGWMKIIIEIEINSEEEKEIMLDIEDYLQTCEMKYKLLEKGDNWWMT